MSISRSGFLIVLINLKNLAMNISTAISTLKEMFPKHSNQLINHILRESGGNLEAAISRLLRTPPDEIQQRKHSSPQKSNKPPVQKEQPPDHIFPPDFLRWPADVEWVSVCSDSTSMLQTEDDVIIPGPPVSRMMAETPERMLETGAITTDAQKSGWSKLKSKFKSMGVGYDHL